MRLLLSMLISLLLLAQLQAQNTDPVTLAIGSQAPDFNLPATDGKHYSLRDFEKFDILVVIFTCNHCPTAQAYEDRMKSLVTDYANRKVGVVAISPNSPAALNLGELGYSDLGDDLADMKIRAKDKGYNFPYLYDGDDQKASKAYGPVATPHAFVFDRQRKLRYVGRFDAREKPGTGNSEDIRAAIDALLSNRAVAVPTTKTFGCSVKWAWKNEYTAQLYKDWAARPVELKDLPLDGVAALKRNEGGGKLRLINIWATWCGPCVQELPDFVKIDRMYRERDFEFITISMDDPAKKEKALQQLRKLEASNRNYLFTGGDKYQFIEAIDSNWQGALPYTMLVEPGGKVVYAKQGPIKPLELKRLIVESKYLGRYY